MAKSVEIPIDTLEERMRRTPESLVFSRVAERYRAQGNLQEAIDICKQGLNHNPQYVTGLVVLGKCYAQQEHLKEAVEEFTRACLLDRRNPLALKMMADIFSKQGMTEKAGDLYHYVLRMDPENPTISKLASQYAGTGQTSLFDILGISAPSVDLQSSQPTRGHRRVPAPEDNNQEVSLDEMPAAEQPEDSIETMETMQMSRADLLSAAGQSVAAPDNEVPHDVPTEELGTVTGDDISDRVSTMFQEEPSGATAPENQADTAPSESAESSDIEELLNPDAIDSAETMELSGALDTSETIPDSDDIGSRISELFGEENTPETPEAAPENQISTPTEPEVPQKEPPESSSEQVEELGVSSDDVASRIDDMFGEQDSAQQTDSPPESLAAPETAELEQEEMATVSPDDVEQRIDEMFGEEERAETAPTSDQPEESQERATEQTSDGSVSGADVSSRIEEMFGESDSAPVQEPETTDNETLPKQESPEPEITEEDGLLNTASIDQDEIDDLTGELDIENLTSESDHTSEGVTGEDVSSRIEEMLKRGESADSPEISHETEDSLAAPQEQGDELTSDMYENTDEIAQSDVLAETAPDSPEEQDVVPKGSEEPEAIDEMPHPPSGELDISEEAQSDTAMQAPLDEAQENSDATDLAERIANSETVMMDRSVLGTQFLGKNDENTSAEDEPGDTPTEIDEETSRIASLDTIEMPLPGKQPEAEEELSVPSAEPEHDTTSDQDSFDEILHEEETDSWEVDSLVPEDERSDEPIPSGDDVANQLDAVLEGEIVEEQPEAEETPDPELPQPSDSEATHEPETVSDLTESSEEAVAESPEALPEARDQAPEETGEVEGTDVEQRLSEMFEDDPVAEQQDLDSLPDDNASESPAEEFFTIDGQNALAENSEPDNSETSTREPESPVHENEKEEESPEFDLEEELEQAKTIAYSPENLKRSLSEQLHEETSEPPQREPEADSFAIPDHVLTPTLADIYFQQGQSRLALQIYERILQRDGENPKIRARVEEIQEKIEAEGEEPAPQAEMPTRTQAQSPVKKKTSPAKKKSTRKKKSGGSKRPLEGVKIKKKFKERINKKKKS